MKEIEVTCKLGKELSADEIQTAAVKALGVSPKMKQQLKYRIMRRSIDARNDILYRYKVEVYKPDEVMAEYVLDEYKDVSSAEPVIIIGAGPGGLTAAIYALRANKTVLVLEKESFGGQITYSPKEENYPGFNEISGSELGEKLVDQALNLGAEIELDTVVGVKNPGSYKIVQCEHGQYQAKSVIIASGSRHRQLGLPRENEFIGNERDKFAVGGLFFS